MVSLIKEVEPELVGPDDAAKMVSGDWILRIMEKHKWVTPRIQRKRMTRYLVTELRQAARRLAFENLPEMPEKKAGTEQSLTGQN
jgi:hypothetical protein